MHISVYIAAFRQ